MHLYILFVSLSGGKLQEEGTFVEVMDQEGSQCIQRNNTLEVKTPGLMALIIMSLTYISKVTTLQISVVVVTTILKLF
jgi:hypothetical protein